MPHCLTKHIQIASIVFFLQKERCINGKLYCINLKSTPSINCEVDDVDRNCASKKVSFMALRARH